jgi:hypothetical protein
MGKAGAAEAFAPIAKMRQASACTTPTTSATQYQGQFAAWAMKAMAPAISNAQAKKAQNKAAMMRAILLMESLATSFDSIWIRAIRDSINNKRASRQLEGALLF